jgi:hypothetical protein
MFVDRNNIKPCILIFFHLSVNTKMSAGYKAVLLHHPNQKDPDSDFHQKVGSIDTFKEPLPFSSQIGIAGATVFGTSLLLTKSLKTAAIITGAHWLAHTFAATAGTNVPIK